MFSLFVINEKAWLLGSAGCWEGLFSPPDSLDCLPTAPKSQTTSLAPGTHCPHCPPRPHLPPDIMLGPTLGILAPTLLSG